MNVDTKNVWLSRLDYFFLLRPMLFFPGWSTMLAGFFIPYKTQWLPPFDPDIDIWLILLLMAGFSMIMGSSFIFNQLCDIESDRKNNKLFIISEGNVSEKSAQIEAYLLLGTGLLLGFLVNAAVGSLFIIFFILTGILYNYKPAAMKDRPWGSLIANALMGWLAFAIGWTAISDPGLQLLTDSLPYLGFNTALYLFTLLPDEAGDRKSGKETLAVVYSIKNLILWAFLLYVAGILVAWFISDFQALLFYVLSLPFFARSVITREVPDTVRTTKFGILFFSLSICLRWPYYFLFMVAGFFFTKWYFRQRFNFIYPNFGGK